MYRAYQVNLDEISSLTTSYDSRYVSVDTKKLHKFESLTNHVNQNGLLDMNAIQEEWFPNLQGYNVFLSHSHADERKVLQFADYLNKEFDLKCFVDSQLWKYSLDLLKIIDQEYCLSFDRKTFDYNLRNQSTAHIHMMLATALIKMMNSCECFIFLKSNNSTYNNDENKLCTHSTWVNLELYMTQVIKITELSRPRCKEILESEISVENKQADIIPSEYSLDLSKLQVINIDLFKNYNSNKMYCNSFSQGYSDNPMVRELLSANEISDNLHREKAFNFLDYLYNIKDMELQCQKQS